MTTRPSPDKRGGAALCCQCGNLRSNGPKMIARDPNRTSEVDDDPRRWRMTRTIYCPICEMPTRHAMLCRSDVHRDNSERFVYKPAPWWTQQGTTST
jgi:hypothetical protein